MLPGKKMFSAMVGVAMLSMPAGALAGRYDGGASAHPYGVQARAGLDGYRVGHAAPFLLADDDDQNRNGDYDRGHPRDRNWNRPRRRRDFDDDDANWGGRNHYDHPYSYYNNPAPPAEWGRWNSGQRQGYLIQRRDGAIRLQRQMRARGDNDAANRLGTAIQQLNRRIRNGG
jgi:hypothetical protein